jgi:predicted ATPase
MRAGAEELERRRPFGVIADCLGVSRAHSSLTELVLGPVPQSSDPLFLPVEAEAEFRAVEGILARIEELCSEGPLALAVEDLQWCDPSSMLVLHRLAARVQAFPMLLFCSARPLPRPRDLESLFGYFDDAGAHRLVLGPLAPDAASRLVEDLLATRPGPGLLRQVAGAGGNPFLIAELVAALVAERALWTTPEGLSEVAVMTLPPSAAMTILHRLSFLPPETLEVLRVASILGSSFSVKGLSLLVGTSAVGLMAALRDCMRGGIVEDRGSRFAFRHDLIREALCEDLPKALRIGLHMQAAQALASAGAASLEVAEHVMRGASPGDAKAVGWLHAAAREAAPRAPAIAVELLERALSLADASGPLQDKRDRVRHCWARHSVLPA